MTSRPVPPSRSRRPYRTRGGALAAGVVATALALTACGGAEPPAAVQVTQAPDVSAEKASPPKPVQRIVWPLTGVETPAVAKRPALAIKIENSRAARPQTGLEYADMVWEEVVEGGITRYVAVYHSRIPKVVEPVRSARPMDPAIVAPLGGVLAYSGAQPQFIRAINRSGIQSVIMDDGDPGFRRDPYRRAPHDVIGSPRTFLAQARKDRSAPPPAQLEFADEVGEGTANQTKVRARTLDVRLSPAQRTVWTWSSKAKAYLRADGSRPSVSSTGKRLSARNVLLLQVRMVSTRWRDPAGYPVPETKLTGTGTGVLASGGKAVRVRWSKKSMSAPMVLVSSSGKKVELDPGTTWVELVPRGSGSWQVD